MYLKISLMIFARIKRKKKWTKKKRKRNIKQNKIKRKTYTSGVAVWLCLCVYKWKRKENSGGRGVVGSYKAAAKPLSLLRPCSISISVNPPPQFPIPTPNFTNYNTNIKLNMGIEFKLGSFCHNNNNNGEEQQGKSGGAPPPPPPVVLGLQPAAMVDHVAKVDCSLLSQVPGEPGGSFPVAAEELKHILRELNTYILKLPGNSSPSKTIAGGSVANTVRGLAAGFRITCGIIGACGNDEQGKLFQCNMRSNKIDLSRLRLKNGATAQCVCLVDELGNRTMRPCLSSSVKVQAAELTREDFKGSKWLVLRYAILNLEVIQAAVRIAKEEGLFVSLDLASFEMVRKYRLPLLQLLESGNIDLCFANEDEAKELLRGEEEADPEAALDFLAKHCQWAVVTLGPNGCIAKHGKEVVRVPAIGKTSAVDATGAGDLFACGFLYGLIKELSLEECCKIGSCSGGSVIRSLGGEVTPENWQWMYKHMQTKGLPVPDVGARHLLK